MRKNVVILLLCFVILLQSLVAAKSFTEISNKNKFLIEKNFNDRIKAAQDLKEYEIWRDAIDEAIIMKIQKEWIPKSTCVIRDRSRWEY